MTQPAHAVIVRYERGVPNGNTDNWGVKGTYVLINRTTGRVAAYKADGSPVWPERRLDTYEEEEHLRCGMWYVGDTSMLLPEGF